VVRHIFQACPVWIYTQSNITSIIIIHLSTITPTQKNHDCYNLLTSLLQACCEHISTSCEIFACVVDIDIIILKQFGKGQENI
jgi:hypothetical protein